MREGSTFSYMASFKGRMPKLWIHASCWCCTWDTEWQAENDVETDVEFEFPDFDPADKLLAELVEITGAMEPVYGNYLLKDSRNLQLAIWGDKYKQYQKTKELAG